MTSAVEDWSMKSEVNTLASTGAVIQTIKNTSGSIGYISIGQLVNL
jgi:ABC-type phosphate transport system substrate-binding protein